MFLRENQTKKSSWEVSTVYFHLEFKDSKATMSKESFSLYKHIFNYRVFSIFRQDYLGVF